MATRVPVSSDLRAPLRPLERALLAYQGGARDASVRVRTDAGGDHDLPAALFFRDADGLLGADRAALAAARGRVLDVGGGAGAIALALQDAGLEVTALDVLPGAVRVMKARGVADARRGDLWTFRASRRYDTVLALMNGAAAAGTLSRLGPLLEALAAPLARGGQILLDSTRLGTGRRADGRYVGELQYQLEHDGRRGPPFPQLFVDPRRLAAAAREAGLAAKVVWRGKSGEYLTRLVRQGSSTRPGRTASRPKRPRRSSTTRASARSRSDSTGSERGKRTS